MGWCCAPTYSWIQPGSPQACNLFERGAPDSLLGDNIRRPGTSCSVRASRKVSTTTWAMKCKLKPRLALGEQYERLQKPRYQAAFPPAYFQLWKTQGGPFTLCWATQCGCEVCWEVSKCHLHQIFWKPGWLYRLSSTDIYLTNICIFILVSFPLRKCIPPLICTL